MDILSALPFEVACDVLACGVLSPADVANVARVSKSWFDIALSELTWYGMAKRSGLLPPSCAPHQGPRACIHEHDETGAFAPVRSWRTLVSLRHALARQWGTDLSRRARTAVPLPPIRHVVSLYGPQPSSSSSAIESEGPSDELVATFRENIARNRLQRRIIPLPRHQALLIPGVQGDAWVVDSHSQELLWGAPPPPPPPQLDEDRLAVGVDQPPTAPLVASVDSDGDSYILTSHVWGLDTCQVDVFRAHPSREVRGHFEHRGELPMPAGLEHGYRTMLKVHGDTAAVLAGGRTFVQWDLQSMECTHTILVADLLPSNLGSFTPQSFDYDDSFIYLSATLLPNGGQGWPPATWDDLFVIQRPTTPDHDAKLVWSMGNVAASGCLFGSEPTYIWAASWDAATQPRVAPEARLTRGPQAGAMTPLDTVFARDSSTDTIVVATGRGALLIRGCATLFGPLGQDGQEEEEIEYAMSTPTSSDSDSTPSPLVAMLDFGTDDEAHGTPLHWPGTGHAQLSLSQGRGLYVSPTGRTLLVDYQNALDPSEVRVLDMSAAKRPFSSPTPTVPFAPVSTCPPPAVPTPHPVAPVSSNRTTAPPTPGPGAGAGAPSFAALAMAQRRPSHALSRRPSFASISHRPSSRASRRPSGLAPAPLAALRAMAAEASNEPKDKLRSKVGTPTLPSESGPAAATLSLSLYRAAQDRMLQRLYGVLPGRPCAAVALTPSAAYLFSVRVDGHPARHAVVQVWDLASSALVAVDPSAAARALSSRTVLSPMDVDTVPIRPVHQATNPPGTPTPAQVPRAVQRREARIALGA